MVTQLSVFDSLLPGSMTKMMEIIMMVMKRMKMIMMIVKMMGIIMVVTQLNMFDSLLLGSMTKMMGIRRSAHQDSGRVTLRILRILDE